MLGASEEDILDVKNLETRSNGLVTIIQDARGEDAEGDVQGRKICSRRRRPPTPHRLKSRKVHLPLSRDSDHNHCQTTYIPPRMPKIRTSRTKPPPEGFEEIESILDEYTRKMRDAESESTEGKRKVEALWPIMRISHTRSRYIYDLYYKREAISRELYDWLLKEGYADAK